MPDSTKQALALLDQARTLIAKAGELIEGKASSRNSISEGVALSWDDPEIRAKRMKRWTCYVDGQEFSSVGEACRSLKYLDKAYRHIGWRGQLVAAAEKDGSGLTDELGREWRVERK